MLSTSVTDPHGPVGGFAFERRMCAMFRFHQQIHPHIFQWEIEDRQATEFVQQHDVFAVGNGHTGKDDSYTSTAVFPSEYLALAERRRGQWTNKQVFKCWFQHSSPLSYPK
jgi:hypothetical protein